LSFERGTTVGPVNTPAGGRTKVATAAIDRDRRRVAEIRRAGFGVNCLETLRGGRTETNRLVIRAREAGNHNS